MRNTKYVVALGAAAALGAASLMSATTASAGTTGSNSGSAVTIKAPTSVITSGDFAKKCKIFKQPSKDYTKGTHLVDLSGLSDFTPVSEIDDVTFSSTLEKRSVPGSWATWGAPPDTESSTPNILYTVGATSLTLDLDGKSKKGGFEIEPNPFEEHEFTAQYKMGKKTVCTVKVSANGSNGAKLIGASVKKGFDSITVTDTSTAVPIADFSIAQIRY